MKNVGHQFVASLCRHLKYLYGVQNMKNMPAQHGNYETKKINHYTCA